MHVFFSFHYSYDYDRIKTLTAIWNSLPGCSMTPFISAEQIAEMMEIGLPSIHQWIEEEISQADAVIVLIGSESYGRYFIEYEIREAVLQKKPVYGLFIHQIPDKAGMTDKKGKSPLDSEYPHYDWTEDRGTENILSWTSEAIENPCGTKEYEMSASAPGREDFEKAKEMYYNSKK